MEQLRVNQDICKELGRIIRNQRFRADFYARPFLKLGAKKETQFRAYFFSVAICHQTYALQHRGKNLYGWEFLEYVFTQLAENESPLLNPDFMLQVGAEKLKYLIRPLFSESRNPSECTLDRLDERVELMMDASNYLNKYFSSRVGDLFSSSGNSPLFSDEGIYSLLGRMKAFADPLHKKSSFLLKLLADAGLNPISRPEELVPIMDYHMQRVLLRTGAVEVLDENLAESLRLRKPIQNDHLVRLACIEAMKQIALASAYDVLRMNDIFYLLGRSCCMEEPLCRSGKCAKEPCSLTQSLHLKQHSNCIFGQVCRAARDDHYLSFWQPIVDTHYY